jgi:hypothetical protein
MTTLLKLAKNIEMPVLQKDECSCIASTCHIVNASMHPCRLRSSKLLNPLCITTSYHIAIIVFNGGFLYLPFLVIRYTEKVLYRRGIALNQKFCESFGNPFWCALFFNNLLEPRPEKTCCNAKNPRAQSTVFDIRRCAFNGTPSSYEIV